MFTRKRLTSATFVMLAGLAVVMFVGFPFDKLGWTSVRAQYGPSAEEVCDASVLFQARTFGVVDFFTDAALTSKAFSIDNAVNGIRQKFLLCSIQGNAAKVYFVGNVYYIPLSSVDSIVPRQYTDDQ